MVLEAGARILHKKYGGVDNTRDYERERIHGGNKTSFTAT